MQDAVSPARRLRAVALVALLVAGCGGQVTPTGSPDGRTSAPSVAPTTGGPGASGDPGPGQSPGPLAPPTLTDPTKIGAALWDPTRVEVGVVSLVEQLGIDIFTAQGELLRDAVAQGPAGFWLFEAEVRGLIEMGEVDAAAIAAGGTPFTLVDLYAGLSPVYPDLSQEQLLDAYVQAYRAAPGDLVRESFAGHPFVPQAAFTRVHLWLFVLDGVLGRPPRATTRTVAFTGGSQSAAGPVAQVQLPQPSSALAQLMALDLSALPIALAHMATLAFTLPVDFTISPASVHEGHGGAGQNAVLQLRSRFVPTPIVSPYTGLPLLVPYRTGLEGMPVTFESPNEATLNAHGTLSGSLGIPMFTDVLGQARLEYTPRPEPAAGQGDLETDVAVINAVIEMRQIVLYMYAAGGAANLAYGVRLIPQPLVIEWHEETVTPPPSVPGTYQATLTGSAPGAGTWTGTGTILCVATPVGTGYRWTVSSGPLTGGLSGLSMGEDADGRSSVYVTPTGLGIEALWGVESKAANAVRVVISGVLGSPSVVSGDADYTYGVSPKTPYSVALQVTCSDTIVG